LPLTLIQMKAPGSYRALLLSEIRASKARGEVEKAL
jgi:hypothetical protein